MKLNAQQLAALAAGADAQTIASLASSTEDTAAEAEVVATAEAEVVVDTAAEVKPVVEAKPAVEAPNPLVAHLMAQLSESQAAVISAKVEAASYKAAAESQDSLVAVVRQALGDRLVALGGTASAADTFSAGNIAAEFHRVNDLFKNKFKVGGVAAQAAPAASVKAEVDPLVDEYLKHSIIR